MMQAKEASKKGKLQADGKNECLAKSYILVKHFNGFLSFSLWNLDATWIKDTDDVLMELIAMAFRVGEECQ